MRLQRLHDGWLATLETPLSGAGKTTTFNILTGDLSMTSGTAMIGGHDIRSNLRDVSFIIKAPHVLHGCAILKAFLDTYLWEYLVS